MKKKIYDYDVKIIHDFCNGLAAFEHYDQRNGVEWGFVNKKLEIVISPQFSKVKNFNNGFAIVQKKDLPGLWVIDKKGQDVCGPFADIPSPGYSQGLMAVRQKEKGLFGYVDKKGYYKIKPIFTVAYQFNHGRAVVVIDGSWYLINKKGDIVSKQIAPYTGL